jgi:predicted transcriptional regulator
MSTTTIRLPDDLKMRIAAAAEQMGDTTHHFMLQAIMEKTLEAEQQLELNKLADQRYANIVATGNAIPWSEMRTYIENKIEGKTDSVRPSARKLAR